MDRCIEHVLLKWLVENKHCGACYRTDFSETIDGVTFSAHDLYCYVDSGHGQFDDGKANGGYFGAFPNVRAIHVTSERAKHKYCCYRILQVTATAISHAGRSGSS